jgi:hypothetical protein
MLATLHLLGGAPRQAAVITTSEEGRYRFRTSASMMLNITIVARTRKPPTEASKTAIALLVSTSRALCVGGRPPRCRMKRAVARSWMRAQFILWFRSRSKASGVRSGSRKRACWMRGAIGRSFRRFRPSAVKAQPTECCRSGRLWTWSASAGRRT